MNILKRLRLKFWRILAQEKHKYTNKYAKLLGVKIADDVRFTGLPDFSTEPWLIEIGEKCLITQNVRFMTHDGAVNIVHRLDDKYKRVLKFGKIVLEDNVFVGANTTIMPSVHIGSHSIVASCSCVTKDIPAGEVWGGVPAKKICTVKEYADKLLSVNSKYDIELLKNMSKRECSAIVAEAYWSNKHYE